MTDVDSVVREASIVVEAPYLRPSVFTDELLAQKASAVLLSVIKWEGDPGICSEDEARDNRLVARALTLLISGGYLDSYSRPPVDEEGKDILAEAIMRMGQEPVFEDKVEAEVPVRVAPRLNPDYVATAMPFGGING